MACANCAGGDSCLCAVVGVDPITVTGSGNGSSDETLDNPYVVSIDLGCEQLQDCVGGMLVGQGFTYDDAGAKFVNVGASDAVLTSDGAGSASFLPITVAPSCEFDQDCVGGMLNTQGFTYNDGAARFDNAGVVGAVLTANGAGGAAFGLATVDSSIADGRLTLTSGLAVTTSDVSAAGVLYYTPYVGNKISLYNGANWVKYAFTERSIALVLTSGKPYDVFIYDNAGTLTLELLVWTNDTTRATAIVRQDGVWCKSGALTRRYLGTIYSSAANQCEDSFRKRYVWNVNNRVPRVMLRSALGPWTYSSTTYRQTNADANNQLAFVIGVSEDAVMAKATSAFGQSPDPVGSAVIGLSLDTLAPLLAAATQYCGQDPLYSGATAKWCGHPGIGKHIIISGEANNTAVSYTYGYYWLQGQIYA